MIEGERERAFVLEAMVLRREISGEAGRRSALGGAMNVCCATISPEASETSTR